MRKPLHLSKELIDKHLVHTTSLLRKHTHKTAAPRLVPEIEGNHLTTGLDGKGCEMTSRNRGRDIYVAPLMSIGDNLSAWVGYNEQWKIEGRRGGSPSFVFLSAGLTVHFGYEGDRRKPQMFRAEWAGWAKWNGGTAESFQAGNAGHPHWQFDALESLTSEEDAPEAADFLAALRGEEAETAVIDFSPHAVSEPDLITLVGRKKISRLHFASAAAWWKKPPEDAHAHAPVNIVSLQSWFDRTLGYLCEELSRL